MIKRAVWVHGNAVVAERPKDLTEEIRIGWGSKFQLRAGTRNWFHVSIPTPVLIDDVRPKLARVFVLFKTSKPESGGVFIGSTLEKLHVYDGHNRVAAITGMRTGNHANAIDSANTWEFDAPLSIFSGLGLSMEISAAQVGTDTTPQPVEFATIGADFV
ncbi:hypothetical protein KB874_01805 [Aestuariicoccus sp. KMU-90]|uniref:Uncharacterized protein n=1 Tax=Thetidibacter halocola TaxID=2827239 RepID=A0A8J8B611_9RHOB|nr:DUF6623 family protein [Thetidibacter halocola]MBS0122852.1 hypothetical protein [Thetidibacter halocola]